MEQVKRIKRSEATWRELFARQAGSGLSVQEFCRGEGINPGVFRRWRSVLSDAKVENRKSGATAKRITPFIDIGAVDTGRSGFEVRLELGAGVVLSIARR
jgi:hypothetical protein